MPTTERVTERISLTFERGVNEGLNESMLPDGASGKMINWEPSPTGEARVRVPWKKGSTTSAPATRKGIGIGFFSRLGVPALVQSSNIFVGSDSSSLSTNAASDLVFPVPTTPGNLIVVIASMANGDGTTTVSSPLNTNYTLAVANTDASGRGRAAIWYRADCPSITEVFSTNVSIFSGFTANAIGSIQAFEFSGISVTSPLDVTGSNSAAGTTAWTTGTTGATAQAVELVVGTFSAEQNLNVTISGLTPASVTPLEEAGSYDAASGASDRRTWVYYYTTSATGTQAISATGSASLDTIGAIATFKAWHTESSTPFSKARFLVANSDSAEYDFWAIDRNNLSAGTWVSEGSIAVSDPTDHVSMAPGLGRTWISNPQFSALYVYDGESVQIVSGSPAPGRTVAVHKNRVFMAGSNAFPGRLWFSNIGQGEIWGDLDYIDIAAEDGEPIEDITPLGEFLVIGKRTGIWLLAGSGLDSFNLTRTPAGGLAPGRSLAPTPYGVVAVGRSFIWIVNEVGAVEKISFPISSSFSYTDALVTTSYLDDNVYINEPTALKMWVFNLQTGTWRNEDVGDASSTEWPKVIGNHDQTQVYAPKNATIGSLLNYRDFPQVTRGKDFDTLTQSFELNTREIFPVGPEEACTVRHLYLRIRQHGGDAGQPAIVVTPQYREIDGTRSNGTAHNIVPKASAGVFRERIDLAHKQGIAGIRFTFVQGLGTTDASAMDIEEATLEYDVERIR